MVLPNSIAGVTPDDIYHHSSPSDLVEQDAEDDQIYNFLAPHTEEGQELERLLIWYEDSQMRLKTEFFKENKKEIEKLRALEIAQDTLHKDLNGRITDLVLTSDRRSFLHKMVTSSLRTRPILRDRKALTKWAEDRQTLLELPKNGTSEAQVIIDLLLKEAPHLLQLNEKAAIKDAASTFEDGTRKHQDTGVEVESYATNMSKEKFSQLMGTMQLWSEIGRPPTDW